MHRHISSYLQRVETEARFTGRARAITCIGNMSKYAVIYAHNGKSNRLRFSELQRVYFYLCALTISTKHAFIKKKKKKRTFGFEQGLVKYSIYRKLWISPILKNEIIRIENNYFHYNIPKDAFLSKGASNDEIMSQDHHQMHDDPKCCFSRSIGNF